MTTTTDATRTQTTATLGATVEETTRMTAPYTTRLRVYGARDDLMGTMGPMSMPGRYDLTMGKDSNRRRTRKPWIVAWSVDRGRGWSQTWTAHFATEAEAMLFAQAKLEKLRAWSTQLPARVAA